MTLALATRPARNRVREFSASARSGPRSTSPARRVVPSGALRAGRSRPTTSTSLPSRGARSSGALHEGRAVSSSPNPWDAGLGGRGMLEELGFKALATTSSGFAFTARTRPTADVTLDEVIAHHGRRRSRRPSRSSGRRRPGETVYGRPALGTQPRAPCAPPPRRGPRAVWLNRGLGCRGRALSGRRGGKSASRRAGRGRAREPASCWPAAPRTTSRGKPPTWTTRSRRPTGLRGSRRRCGCTRRGSGADQVAAVCSAGPASR